MPRIPRQLLVDPTEVGIYHCINRCVRRAFLCGRDAVTGKSFEHRKEWIQNRLQFLAGQFGIDVLGFAVMSNHLHVVLRNRPDVVRDWSDREVALRWWHLFPTRSDECDLVEPAGAVKDGGTLDPLQTGQASAINQSAAVEQGVARDGSHGGNPLPHNGHGNANASGDNVRIEPTESDLGMILNDPKRLAEIRARLSSIPWFMRCLAEPIARQSNKEDQCTGRFWEGRYKCQPILDESALAACLAYVDLNPIRAGVAKSPETSRFTSVFERIQARREEAAHEPVATVPPVSNGSGPMASQSTRGSSRNRSGGSPGAPGSPSRKTAAAMAPETSRTTPARDQWLSPLSLNAEVAGGPVAAGRASNKGCLAMSLDDYLRLVDWTGRQIPRDKKGAIPADLAPILDRLQISGESWLELIADFGRQFRRAAGRPESLRRDAERRRAKRTEGIVNSRALFA